MGLTIMPWEPHRLKLLVLLFALLCAAGGCGKKNSPRPPEDFAPGSVRYLTAEGKLEAVVLMWQAPESSLTADERASERIVRDYRRFAWFSDGWVARAPAAPEVYGDARYSLSTERFEPIWGVRFHPEARIPTEWVDFTAQNKVPLAGLWRELSGNDPGYGPLPGRAAVR